MWSYFFDFSEYPDYAQSVPVIVLALFLGVVAAALIALYHKNVLGSFVRFLLKSGANCPENAVKYGETSYKNNIFVRSAIRSGYVYKNVLRSVPPEGLVFGKKLSEKNRYIAGSAYYIPEELTFRAENIFSKRGTTWLSALIGVLLAAIVALVSLAVIPDILTFLNNLFSL